jgi:predicted metal-dependent hydrolase
MPNRIVHIPGVGEVTIVKRRRSSSLRLSVTSSGKVRVGIPYWTPYAAGEAFAKNRRQWIVLAIAEHRQPLLRPGSRIGKTFRLHFYRNDRPGASRDIRTRLSGSRIGITTNLMFDTPRVQQKAYAACERALRKEVQTLLLPRLKLLSRQYGLSYTAVRIKKMTSRWGSCSETGVITLNSYLSQLPWRLVDYVLLHELAHTRHLNHSKEFWYLFEAVCPDARQLRREIREHKPRVEPA